jgi:hypothetical protein
MSGPACGRDRAGRGKRALARLSLALAALFAVPAQAIEARVAASLSPTGPVWVGERVTLRVDLKTDGLSFRGQRIRLPDVSGALLLQDAIGTVKLSESIEGETWQVLRYEYPLFPQREGRVEIPAIEVDFSATAGFGTDPKAFRLRTLPLSLSTRVPPGVEDVSRLVTTPDLSLRVELDPEPTGLRVGDAFTRRIERRAVDVSAMAFAPLDASDLPGIAVYAKAPEIDERRQRGEMVGTRIDAATYVLQTPGTFVVPGFEIQWWDPQRRRLQTETVPSLEIEVAEGPWLAAAPERLDAARTWAERNPGWVAAFVLATAFVVAALARGGAVAVGRLRGWREARREGEPARFAELVRACRANEPARSYRALLRWLDSHEDPLRQSAMEVEISRQRERVQHALVEREAGWTGGPLLRAARRARREGRARQRRDRRSSLVPFNPEDSARSRPA